MNSIYPIALSIAGSDSGGGAGIQADLKTFSQLGVYALSVITALTAQNTRGVQDVLGVPGEFVKKQMISVLGDIGTDAVKTGMLWSDETIWVVAEMLQGKNLPLVVDPVLAAKRGESLFLSSAIPVLKKKLFPLATLVTPNIPEAEILTGVSPIISIETMKLAAQGMIDMGVANVLIKGGHLKQRNERDEEHIFDLFFDGKDYLYLEKERLNTPHLHGVGCTLAAAITAFLAKHLPMSGAISKAREFTQEAIKHSLALGKGIGPVNPSFGNEKNEKHC